MEGPVPFFLGEFFLGEGCRRAAHGRRARRIAANIAKLPELLGARTDSGTAHPEPRQSRPDR